MKTVVLIMKRASFAQGLVRRADEFPGIRLFYEPDYAHAEAAIRAHRAQVALLEVTESGECDVGYCLALCGRLGEAVPECKRMLMCPEGNRDAVAGAVQAKQTGAIHDFVFYDVSVEYLISNLSAI